MKEVDINRTFTKALDWGHKIADPPQAVATMASKRPFDGFGRIGSKAVFFESKFERGLKSFNLKRIDVHQREALDQACLIENAFVFAVLGCHVARGDTRIYVFDWRCLRERENNILKKQLEALPYHAVKKGLIEFDETKIIALGVD